MNKASGGNGIPVELFQTLKDDTVKVLHSICQQIWKTQQWPQDCKRPVLIPITKKGNAKECSNYHKEIQPVHSNGDQSWVFFGRTDAKGETSILWPPPMWRVDSLEKTQMLGGIGDRRSRGRQRMRWLDGITDLMDAMEVLPKFSQLFQYLLIGSYFLH